MALDPEYGRAYAALGHTLLIDWIFGVNEDPAVLDEAMGYARKAIAIDPDESEGYGLAGHIYLWTHRHDQGIEQVRKAISLEPGNAKWLAALGEQLTWAGKPREGIPYMEQAMRLDPKYPAWPLWNLGHAFYLIGNFDRALPFSLLSYSLNIRFGV